MKGNRGDIHGVSFQGHELTRMRIKERKLSETKQYLHVHLLRLLSRRYSLSCV